MRPQATTTIPGGMPLPTRSFVYDQRMVFGMTFLSCVTVHVVRKSFTASKMELHAESDWLFPSKYLGTLDMLFLLCYAVGLLFSGNVIGYFNPKKSLLMSMVLTFVCYLCMGTVHFLGVRELRFFALLMSLNGFAQSPMWPACLTLLSHWYSKETRGAVFGWWSISVSLGNILGNLVISSLTSAGFSAGMMLAAPSVFALASALTLVFITNHPRERSDYASLDIFASQQESRVIPSGGQPNSVGINDAAQGEDASETKSLSLFQTFLLPGVAVYSVSLMFIKSTAFACVFWLPFYLSESPLGLSFSYADEIGSLGDVGTMMGAVMIGMMSDRFGGRLDGVLSSVYLAAAAIMIHMLYAATSAVMVPFSLLMVGMMTGGPNMLIGAAVATKLGSNPKLDSQAVSSVIGIMNGIGCFGAAIGQYTIGLFVSSENWSSMFGFLMVSELVVVGIITFECLPEYRLIHSMLTNLVTGKITHALVSEGERAEEKQDLLADSSGHHSFAQKHHYRQQQHTEKCIGKGDVNSRQSIDFSNEEAWDNYDFAYEDDYPKKDDLDFESWKDDAMLDGVDFHSALGGDKIV